MFLLFAVAVAGALWWLKSPGGEAWLRQKAEEALNDAMSSGRAEIVGLSNAGLGELAVEKLVLWEGSEAVLEVHEAEIAVRLLPLIRGEVRVKKTSAARVAADLVREAGQLNLQRLFEAPEEEEGASGGADYAVDVLTVDELDVRYRDEALDVSLQDGRFSGGLSSVEGGVRLTAAELEGRVEEEPVLLRIQEGLFGPQQQVSGLEIEGLGSRAKLSGELFGDDFSLEIQEGLLSHALVQPYLGEAWDEEIMLQASIRRESETFSLRGDAQGLGGRVEADFQEVGGQIEGALSLRSVNLQPMAWGLGEGPILSAKLRVPSSPREAVQWILEVEPLTLSGEAIEGVTARGVWDGEGVRQVSATLVHEAARVNFEGDIERDRLAGRVSANLPRLTELEQRGIAGLRGQVLTQGQLSVDWSSVVQADFEGDLFGTAMGFPAGVAMGSIEGPLELRYRDGSLRAEGGLKGQQGQMDTSSFGAFFGGWQVDLAEGQPPVWEVDVEAEALEHLGVSIGAISAGFGGVGSEASGRIDLLDTAYRHLAWPTAEAVVDLQSGVSVELDMQDPDRQAWRTVAQLSGTELEISEHQMVLDGVPWRLSQPVRGEVSSTRIDLSAIALETQSGESVGLGLRRTEEELSLQLEAKEFPLAALNTLLGTPGHSGQLTLDLSLEKQAGGPVLSGRLSGRKMLIPGHLLGARLDLDLRPQSGSQGLSVSLGRGKKSLASGDFLIPLGDGVGLLDWSGALAGELLLMPSDNRVFENVLPGLPELPKGWTAAQVTVGGTPLQPRIQAELGLEWMLLEGPEFFRGDLSLGHVGDGLSIEGAVRQSGRPILRTKGSIETGLIEALAWIAGDGEKPPVHRWDHWWKNGQVRVLARDMDVATFRSALPFALPLEGLLSGSVLVEGKPSSPRARVGLNLTEGRMGVVDVPVAMVSVNPGDSGYEVFSYSRIGEEELRLEGNLGVDLSSDRLLREKLKDETLELRLNGAVPLAVLEAWTSRVGSGQGAVVISGGLQGSLVRPEPQLKLGLDRGSLDWLPEGISVESASFTGTVDSDGVRIPRFSMKTAPLQSQALSLRDHKSRITGEIVWPFASDAAATLELSAEDAWLAAIPGRILRVDGGLSAEGTPERMELRGAVAVNEGRYGLTPEQWLAEDALMLDPAIHLNRRIETLERTVNTDTGPSRWHYVMDIDLGQNTWLDAEIPLSSGYGQVASKVSTVGLESRIEGLLQAKGDEGGLLLQGEVDVRKGKAKVFGTDFGVETGALVFSGASLSNPELDLRAVYSSSQFGDIRVDIGGRPAEMSLGFSSSEGWSDTDMASILLFRMPASSMTQSEGGAGLDLMGAAIAVMAGQASNFLQMSRVVDRVEVESSGDAISAIRLGWSVGDDLFVTFSQDYTAEMDENQSEVTLEWLLSRRLQAEVSTGDAGESSADLYMRWRF